MKELIQDYLCHKMTWTAKNHTHTLLWQMLRVICYVIVMCNCMVCMYIVHTHTYIYSSYIYMLCYGNV